MPAANATQTSLHAVGQLSWSIVTQGVVVHLDSLCPPPSPSQMLFPSSVFPAELSLVSVPSLISPDEKAPSSPPFGSILRGRGLYWCVVRGYSNIPHLTWHFPPASPSLFLKTFFFSAFLVSSCNNCRNFSAHFDPLPFQWRLNQPVPPSTALGREDDQRMTSCCKAAGSSSGKQ